jgi:hypothetical protein
MKTEEICFNYYEYEVFDNSFYYNLAFNFLTNNDSKKQINRELFNKELSALRCELFGFAFFINKLSSLLKDKREHSIKEWTLAIEAITNEIMFTKTYFNESNKSSNIWNDMSYYNNIFFITQEDEIIASLTPLFKVFPGIIETGAESRIAEIGKQAMRDTLVKELNNKIKDTECIDRLKNRMGIYEKDLFCNINQYLATRFAIRTDSLINSNYEYLFKVQQLVNSIYYNAKNYIEILPFNPEYQRKMNLMAKGLREFINSKRENK